MMFGMSLLIGLPLLLAAVTVMYWTGYFLNDRWHEPGNLGIGVAVWSGVVVVLALAHFVGLAILGEFSR